MNRCSTVALTLLLALPAIVCAERIHNAALHWSIDVPAGWHAVRQEIVEAMDDEAARRQPGRNFKYRTAFTKDPSGALACPYILVQQTNASLSGHTYDEIAQGLGAEDTASSIEGARDKWSDVLKGVGAGRIVLERAQNRMLFRMSVETVDGQHIRAICAGYLGRDTIIQFNCYATSETFDSLLPEFEAFVSTFAFDPGYELVPATEADRTRQSAIRALIGGAVAGGAVVVLLVLYGLIKKARNRASANP